MLLELLWVLLPLLVYEAAGSPGIEAYLVRSASVMFVSVFESVLPSLTACISSFALFTVL